MAALRQALERETRIAYALLFGSHGRGSAHSRSDLDIAVGLV
jgi:predicted nucleotidyltransferase